MNVKQAYFTYLNELTQAKQKEAATLKEAGQADEGNLVKIELNIIGVFKTVFQAMERTGGDFVAKMEEIKTPWEGRLKEAKTHGDYETETQEKRKLAIHAMLKNKWQELISHDNG